MDSIGPKIWILSGFDFISLDWIGPDRDSIGPVWSVLELNQLFHSPYVGANRVTEAWWPSVRRLECQKPKCESRF